MGRLYSLTTYDPQEVIEAAVAVEAKQRGLSGEELGRRIGMEGKSLRDRMRRPGQQRDLTYVRNKMITWLNTLEPMPVDYGGANEGDVLAKFAMSNNAGDSMSASFEGIFRELVAMRRIMAEALIVMQHLDPVVQRQRRELDGI